MGNWHDISWPLTWSAPETECLLDSLCDGHVCKEARTSLSVLCYAQRCAISPKTLMLQVSLALSGLVPKPKIAYCTGTSTTHLINASAVGASPQSASKYSLGPHFHTSTSPYAHRLLIGDAYFISLITDCQCPARPVFDTTEQRDSSTTHRSTRPH